MNPITSRRIAFVICSLAASFATSLCQAHFLWIKSVEADGKPNGLLFFNESPLDESYHFPEKIAKAKLYSRAADGKQSEVNTKAVDTDERVGLIGPLAEEKSPVLETSQRYGIYGTSLLGYHSKHIRGTAAREINSAGTSEDLKLEIVPKVGKDDVELTVLWEGKPLADSNVTFLEGDKEPVEKITDKDGHVTYKPEVGGLVGVLANTLEKNKTGELGGKPYKGVMHYATLTFNLPAKEKENASDAKAKDSAADSSSAALPSASVSVVPPLPEAVASFGAVVSDGWLYVYGGHIGEEHAHSAANLSKNFRRIKLEGGTAWEDLPMQTTLQGFPLVAHGGKVYRVGGLNILNATTEDKEDLHSTAEFAEYDPATQKWTALAPLPAARSSHNAAVIGDRLYVVGGWRLEGKSPGTWEPDALVYDFTKPSDGWQKLALPEFKRRALGAGIWQDKLFAIGGMDEKGKTSMQVDIFDTKTGKWQKGPNLPGAGMAGFGVSAWNLGGNLYVSGMRGVLYRLSGTGSAWEEVGRLETPRFFHQLVPGPNGGLLVVGGDSMNGHLATIEQIDLSGTRVSETGKDKQPL